MGLPADVVTRVLPFVTVSSGRAEVDIVNAAPEVSAALPGMIADLQQRLLAQRANAPQDGRALIEMLGPTRAYATIDAANAIRVLAHIELAGFV